MTQATSISNSPSAASSDVNSGDVSTSMTAAEPPPSALPGATAHDCDSCLQGPCITSNPMVCQFWQRRASKKISARRKVAYKKFWGWLDNCGLWRDERYKAWKETRARNDLGRSYHSALWQREIKPACVLKVGKKTLFLILSATFKGIHWFSLRERERERELSSLSLSLLSLSLSLSLLDEP